MPGEQTDGRIKLAVLGGFLGSGKTTWLRHQLHEGLFGDALVIVNEAAGTSVDDVVLGRWPRLAGLAGGCACCTGRADMIALLRRVCDDRSRSDSAGERLQRIVLETSGLADPGAIVDAIRSDPVLVHHIVVAEILVTVDALHALEQLRREPLGRRQIEPADRLVVTKVDEADASDVARLLATLRRISPGAVISGAAHGSDSPLPTPASEPEPLDLQSAEEPGPIFPTSLTLGDGVDWTAFGVWLSALLFARGEDVLRVKGVVRTPAGRLLLQSVRKVVQSPELLPSSSEQSMGDDNRIVIIGRGYRAEDLERSLHHFAGAGQA